MLLVTHDNRILDVADRIVHLEDGRLRSFTDAVTANTRHMMDMLARSNRKGELQRRVAELPGGRVRRRCSSEVTRRREHFLRVTELGQDDAFQSMLEQVLEAFTLSFGELLEAERASLFLVDARARRALAEGRAGGGRPAGRHPHAARSAASPGEVARTGRSLRVDDAYADPLFNPEVDRATGFRTRSILCVPIRDRAGRVFAVAQLLNKRERRAFDAPTSGASRGSHARSAWCSRAGCR